MTNQLPPEWHCRHCNYGEYILPGDDGRAIQRKVEHEFNCNMNPLVIKGRWVQAKEQAKAYRKALVMKWIDRITIAFFILTALAMIWVVLGGK